MPTVLVFGATGYIGLPFAQSLLRSGNYIVYGLARSPEKGKMLVFPRSHRADHFPHRLTAPPSTYLIIWKRKTANSKDFLTSKTLTANEIVPFIDDLGDMDKIAYLITSVPIDIVVDTTFPNESAAPLLDTLFDVPKSRLQILAKEGRSAPKLGFVYVSGIWVRKLKI